MGDFLSRLNGGELIGLCFFAFLTIAVKISVIVGYLKHSHESDNKARLAEDEIALKQEMIKRGMSADEIERVLKASSPEKKVV